MGGYVPAAEGGAGGGRGRGARYPPLSALVVSAIAAFSAVIVLAVIHSVINTSGSIDRPIDLVVDRERCGSCVGVRRGGLTAVGGVFLAGVRRRAVADADAAGA
jgi:hypothetical protein